MEFPRSLAHWKKYLQIFPEDLSLALAPLAQRIAAAVGPLQAASNINEGDPDGFDGLARKGSYERLLISEWLLAEALPFEFTRRAIMGEQAFLKIARREPSSARVSLALFDAGPGQLGRPRIAHIAALIALSQRAELAGANFGWSIMQMPDKQIFPGRSVQEITALIKSRTLQETSIADLESWRARLLGKKDLPLLWPEIDKVKLACLNLDDIWLIGSEWLEELPNCANFSRLLVKELLTPDANALSLTIKHQKFSEEKESLLELPPDKICLRLITKPFEIEKPHFAAPTFFVNSNFVWCDSGKKLLARNADNNLIIFSWFGGSQVQPKEKIMNRNIAISGAGIKSKNKTLIVSEEDGAILITECRSKRVTKNAVRYSCKILDGFKYVAARPGDKLLYCYFNPDKTEYLVNDKEGKLFYIYKEEVVIPEYIAEVIATNVLAIAETHNGIFYVGLDQFGQWSINKLYRGDEKILINGSPRRALIGDHHFKLDNYTIIALQITDYEWQLRILNNTTIPFNISAPIEDEVFGIMSWSLFDRTELNPGLLTLDKDRRQITHYDNNQKVTPIYRSHEQITHITASAFNPFIAFATVEGNFYIYALAAKKMIYEYKSGKVDEKR